MRILFAGVGSIGLRHLTNLASIRPGWQYLLLRQRNIPEVGSIANSIRLVDDLPQALKLGVDAAIVSAPSSFHFQYVVDLLRAGIPMYVEKPVVVSRSQIEIVSEMIDKFKYDRPTMAGCNLRFLASLQTVSSVLESDAIGRVVRATFEAGSWLPAWRPQRDHRKVYSAHSAMGGGVILDLVHEVDAIRWFCGEIMSVRAYAAEVSSLGIDSEAVAGAIMRTQDDAIIGLGLDYVARPPLRQYRFIGEKGTIVWDLGKKYLEMSNVPDTGFLESDPKLFDVEKTYVDAMSEFVFAIEDNVDTSYSLVEGLKSVELAIRIKEDAYG